MNAIARRTAVAAAALLVTGCANLDDPTPDQGLLIGAGSGALVGAAIGDGGVIAPVIGAVGGAVLGKELAERDPLFDR